MRLYRHMMRDGDAVEVPVPVSELSTRRLLTITWLGGARLMEVKDWPGATRNQAAANMFPAWNLPCYDHASIHGDPQLVTIARDSDDRATMGLGSVFLHASAEINWHRMFHELIRDFDMKALAKRQTAALKKAQVEAPL